MNFVEVVKVVGYSPRGGAPRPRAYLAGNSLRFNATATKQFNLVDGDDPAAVVMYDTDSGDIAIVQDNTNENSIQFRVNSKSGTCSLYVPDLVTRFKPEDGTRYKVTEDVAEDENGESTTFIRLTPIEVDAATKATRKERGKKLAEAAKAKKLASE